MLEMIRADLESKIRGRSDFFSKEYQPLLLQFGIFPAKAASDQIPIHNCDTFYYRQTTSPYLKLSAITT
jgi:hypothetical protein